MARARKASPRPDLPVHGLTANDIEMLHAIRPIPSLEKAAAIEAQIDSFVPSREAATETPAVIEFLRPFLMACDLEPSTVRNMLLLLPRLGIHHVRVGINLTLDNTLSVKALNRYVAEEGKHDAPATQSRTTSAAMQLGRFIGMKDYPPIHRPFPRSKMRAPYSDEETDAYLEMMTRAPRPLRDDATTLIHLARSGVTTGQIRALRGTDIIRLEQTCAVLPNGSQFALRPLSAVASRFLRKRAAEVGADHLLRPGMNRLGSVQETIDLMTKYYPLPRFQVQRAVAAWRVDVLNASGLSAFLLSAGLKASSKAVEDLHPYLRQPSDQECWSLLATAVRRTR